MNLSPEEKRAQDKALSLREFAQAGGISYPLAITLARAPGFPIFHGKIWWEDFVVWRRQVILRTQNHDTPEDRRTDGHRSEAESAPKNDLKASLPPRAARLFAEVG